MRHHFYSTQDFEKFYDIMVFNGHIEKMRIGDSERGYYMTLYSNDKFFSAHFERAVKMMIIFTPYELINLCKEIKYNDSENFDLIKGIVKDASMNFETFEHMVY